MGEESIVSDRTLIVVGLSTQLSKKQFTLLTTDPTIVRIYFICTPSESLDESIVAENYLDSSTIVRVKLISF